MAYSIGGAILFPDGTEAALNDARVVSLTLDEGADGALLPGAVLSAACTLELNNGAGAWSPGGELLGDRALIGATIAPLLTDGEDEIPLGYFRVESAVCREQEAILCLRGADALSFELSGTFADSLTYPSTLGTILRGIVSQTRLNWNGVMPNAGAIVDAAPDWGEVTNRRALSYAVCAAGAYAALGRDGSLEIRSVWDEDRAPYEISPEVYMNLEADDLSFGPADALALTPAAADAEDMPEERFYYATGERTRVWPLSISENPLFREGAAHLNALAAAALGGVAGLCGREMKLRAVGMPEARIGDVICVTDLDGGVCSGVLSRRSLRYDGALTDELSCRMPETDESGVMRVFTKEGGLNAAALMGTVNGALLSARSVTTAKLAAGAVTAEKLAAGSVTADRLAAGAVDAGALAAVTAKLASLTAGNISADALGAAVLRAAALSAASGSFDAAAVKHLVSSVFNLDGEGTMADVCIENLVVKNAQMISATLGSLVLRAADGHYYRLDVGASGVTAEDVTDGLTPGELSAGLTADKRTIIETELAADSLSATDFRAQTALINRIYAATVDCAELCARQAFIDELRTLRIAPSAGHTLTLSALADDFQSAMRLTREGGAFYVDVGQVERGNMARLSEAGLMVLLGGEVYSLFAPTYAQFGNYQLRKSADGGLVFKLAEG